MQFQINTTIQKPLLVLLQLSSVLTFAHVSCVVELCFINIATDRFSLNLAKFFQGDDTISYL